MRSASLEQDRAELELETERGPATIRCATDRATASWSRFATASGATVARSAAGGPAGAASPRLIPGREHPLVASLSAQLARLRGAARGGDPGRWRPRPTGRG